MMLIVVIATAAHLIVRLTGDLYTAMLVHFVYDFFAASSHAIGQAEGVPSSAEVGARRAVRKDPGGHRREKRVREKPCTLRET